MVVLNTAAWIGIALLVPFWWGLGLFILALLGDVSPGWRPHVSRLLDRVERPQAESPRAAVISRAVAA